MENLLSFLESLAHNTSLELFVVLGAFLEEIIAPIPSPFVMTTAAVIGQAQNYGYFQLFIVIILAAIAKTAATYVVYFASDKAEDVVVGKLGKYVGVSHREIERIGKLLTGSWWDDVLLFFARALPFVPSFLVSVGAGVIKYNVKSYLVMTFLGTIFRNLFYLVVGYLGWAELVKFWDQIKGSPAFVVALVVGVIALIWFLMKVKDDIFERMMNFKKEN